jgi:hypothetical protein
MGCLVHGSDIPIKAEVIDRIRHHDIEEVKAVSRAGDFIGVGPV